MNYTEMYGQIQTGDLLLCHGDNWISDVIQDVTDGPFSHVAVLYLKDGQVWIAEEWEGVGFQTMPALDKIKTYGQSKCSWGVAPTAVRINPGGVMKVIEEYQDNPSLHAYEYGDLLKVGVSDMFGIKFDLSKDTGGGVCSVLGARAWSNCGIIFPSLPSPNDFRKLVFALTPIEYQG